MFVYSNQKPVFMSPFPALHFKDKVLPFSIDSQRNRLSIIHHYWHLISYFNLLKERGHIINPVSLKFLKDSKLSPSNPSYLNALKSIRNKSFTLELQEREQQAWVDYIYKFRIWYSLNRSMSLQPKPNSNVRALSKLTFYNLGLESTLRPAISWRTPVSFSLRNIATLFRKKKFKRRFHIFRLEKGFKQKNTKRKKVKTFLDYSHLRFHKLRLHYTTLGYKQFQQLFYNLQHFKKNIVGNVIATLELRLEYFLYRINFAPSKYFSRQYIKHGAFLVNNRTVYNRNYVLKQHDTVSINYSKFWLIFNTILNRLFSMKRYLFGLGAVSYSNTPLLFVQPDYVEADYALLTVSIIRFPRLHELFVPNHIELDLQNRNIYHIYNSYL